MFLLVERLILRQLTQSIAAKSKAESSPDSPAPTEAERVPENVTESLDVHLSRLLQEAESYLNNERYSQAAEIYQRIIDVDSQNQAAKDGLARAKEGSATVAKRYVQEKSVSRWRFLSSKAFWLGMFGLAILVIFGERIFLQRPVENDKNNLQNERMNSAVGAKEEMLKFKTAATNAG